MGINTGPALVGNIGSVDVRCFTAIGDTINLAARLEGSAPVEGIVIGPVTCAQLGDATVVEPLGGLTLKGKAAPLEAYRLLSLR
jgi:adenylate cyclase